MKIIAIIECDEKLNKLFKISDEKNRNKLIYQWVKSGSIDFKTFNYIINKLYNIQNDTK